MRAHDDEDGSVLLAVLLFGALSAFVVLALAQRIVTESRAVDESLVQTRAYWAAMGINTYVLSRTMQMGDCGSNCGNALLPLQQGYPTEIKDLQTWQYPDVGSAYRFQLAPVVSQDAVSGAQEMLIRTTFASPAAPVPDALANLARIRPVEFRYCLVAFSLSPCKSVSGLTKALPGYQLITSVHRPIS